MKAPALAALLALCLLPAAPAAQEKRPPVRHDARQLRRALADALKGEFELVRDELTRRSNYDGDAAFWLVHVRPRRAGHFSLKYTYTYEYPDRKKGLRYLRAERSVSVPVGPRDCRRKPQYMNAFYQPCLGDTVILPIALGAHKSTYTRHAFFLAVNSVAGPGAPAPWEATPTLEEGARLNDEQVANPLAEHLTYLGNAVHVMAHRAAGYRVMFYATFEAIRPGRFNVALGARRPGDAPGSDAFAASVPVIVVARGTPVTWLVTHDMVRGDGGDFVSHSGQSYFTTPVVMQLGERLALFYHGFSRHERLSESKPDELELSRTVAPVIHRLPFRVERAQDFNEWIVDHPPYSIKN